MKDRRTLGLTLLWLVLGSVLFVLGVTERIDSYWCGMGGGLLGVGIAQLIRRFRYRTDPVYREKQEIRASDERNLFLSGRAWMWASTLFVVLNGGAVVVLRLLGHHDQSLWAAYNVCILITLYWLSFFVLRKKY